LKIKENLDLKNFVSLKELYCYATVGVLGFQLCLNLFQFRKFRIGAMVKLGHRWISTSNLPQFEFVMGQLSSWGTSGFNFEFAPVQKVRIGAMFMLGHK